MLSSFGQTVQLNYLPKEEGEYTLPLDPESGVHQFLCEKHYLSSLDVYSSDGSLLYSQQLGYTLLPMKNQEIKRMLTSVSQVNRDGEVLPPLELIWNTEGEFAGHLLKITYPRGGALEFGYTKYKAEDYQPSFFLDVDEGWEKTVVNKGDFITLLFTREMQSG